jgi:hypothetical protein
VRREVHGSDLGIGDSPAGGVAAPIEPDVARVNQFFTPDLFLRLFAQTATVTDRHDVQAVFVYRYRPPFGTIQLAFQRGEVPFGQQVEQRNTFFLKTTAVF